MSHAVVKIIDSEQPTFSSETSDDFNWNYCIICQKSSLEDLQCPLDTKRTDVETGAGYVRLDADLERCRSLSWFPVPIKLHCLNDGSEIATTLQMNEAKWHKTCRNKFSELKINRYEKFKREETCTDKTEKKVPRLHDTVSVLVSQQRQ